MKHAMCISPQATAVREGTEVREEKIPGGDFIDEPGFVKFGHEWKNVAAFESGSGIVLLPPEIALNERLFQRVMNAA